VIVGHVALALPYVIVVVTARLRTFDPTLEEAARSLGASSWQITRMVSLPWIARVFRSVCCIVLSDRTW